MIPLEAPLKSIVCRLARCPFVQSAITGRADLGAFCRWPGPRVVAGLSAIILSYLIGWPLITLLGAAAVYYENAAIAVVGGPVAYGLSHLVFILGMVLAGAKYSHIFFQWATRAAMEPLLARYGLPLPAPLSADVAVMADHDEQGGRPGAGSAPCVHPYSHGRPGGQQENHRKG